MSILDDAIREHLELKRAHGADEGELQKLEDDAFGPPQRPDEIDPFAEAPTEFLVAPGEDVADAPAIFDEEARDGRRPNITDLQEAPPAEEAVTEAPVPEGAPPPAPEDAAPESATPFLDELAPPLDAPPPSPADAAELPPPPPPGEAVADLAPPVEESRQPVPEEAPPVEEPPAAPSPAAEEPPPAEASVASDAVTGTEERQSIIDQPTQMFDVQAHVEAEAAAEAPAPAAPVEQSGPTDEAPVEQASPTDDELVDAAQAAPHAAPSAPEEPAAPAPADLEAQPPLESRGPDAEVAGHPPTEAEPEEESTEYDFFNEQRLSDELDAALDAPTGGERAMPQYEEGAGAQGAIFDFESQGSYEEDPSEEVLRRADEREEAPQGSSQSSTEAEAEDEDEENDYDPATGHDDVLEDTPRFLEDAPEDDDLWFEQRPPKDFDLD